MHSFLFQYAIVCRRQDDCAESGKKCRHSELSAPDEHILREAKLYRKFLEMLEQDGDLPECSMKENECFWNQIMMEHAQFIRGLLDPSEAELFCTANNFTKEYGKLLENSRNTAQKAQIEDSLSETIRFRNFKTVGVQSIQQRKIRSIILPLLADHVLREGNHYIRILQH